MTQHYAHSYPPNLDHWRDLIRYVLPRIEHRKLDIAIGTGLQQPALLYQEAASFKIKPKAAEFEKVYGRKPGPKKGWRKIQWAK